MVTLLAIFLLLVAGALGVVLTFARADPAFLLLSNVAFFVTTAVVVFRHFVSALGGSSR